MKLKWFHFADVAEIQEDVTDELKKLQKEEFAVKACLCAIGAYFGKKVRSSHVPFFFFKRS